MSRLASKNKVSGKIMIEFLLAAPVLLSISGGTIEVANFMRLTQIATVTSQEAANQAYRKCSSITRLVNPADPRYNNGIRTDAQIDHSATTAAVTACLDGVRLSTMRNLNALNGSSSENAVHLIVARYNPREANYEEFDSLTTADTQPPANNQTAGAYGGGQDDYHGSEHSRRNPRLAGGDVVSKAFDRQVHLDGTKVKFILASGVEVDLITQENLQKREQVIVGQAVAGYTPIIRFFNLAILYSGEFRATTLL